MSKFKSFVENQLVSLKNNWKRGVEWTNIYGLANMTSSALLTIFLMLFVPAIWAMVLSIALVMTKCFFDKQRGSGHECHDFICSVIGVIGGLILGVAHAAVILL